MIKVIHPQLDEINEKNRAYFYRNLECEGIFGKNSYGLNAQVTEDFVKALSEFQIFPFLKYSNGKEYFLPIKTIVFDPKIRNYYIDFQINFPQTRTLFFVIKSRDGEIFYQGTTNRRFHHLTHRMILREELKAPRFFGCLFEEASDDLFSDSSQSSRD